MGIFQAWTRGSKSGASSVLIAARPQLTPDMFWYLHYIVLANHRLKSCVAPIWHTVQAEVTSDPKHILVLDRP